MDKRVMQGCRSGVEGSRRTARLARAVAAGLGLAASLLGCGAERDEADLEEDVAEASDALLTTGPSFTIEPRTAPAMCLDGLSGSNGLPKLSPCNALDPNQMIHPVDVTTGQPQFGLGKEVWLVQDRSQRCLNMSNVIDFRPCAPVASQRWIVDGDPKTNFYRLLNEGRPLCLAYMPGASGSEFTPYYCGTNTDFVRPTPAVRTVNPTTLAVKGGDILSVSGAFLGDIKSITVGGAVCPPLGTTFSQVTCIAPPGEGMVELVAHTGGSPADLTSWPVTVGYRLPTITSVIAPQAVANGLPFTVKINGSDFGRSPSVTVGSSGCAISQSTDTQIVCATSTLSGGQANVVVRTGSGASNGSMLAITVPPPAISSLLPASFDTPGGALLAIVGSFFGQPGSVTVGGVACPTLVWSSTSISCRVPAGEGTQPVVVTTSLGLESSPKSVSYWAPSVTSVWPGTVPSSGGALTIVGTSFGLAPTVTVGQTACAIDTASHTQIVCTLPALPTGSYELQVTTQSGTSGATTVTVE